MTAKSRKNVKKTWKQVIGGVLFAALIVGLAFAGSAEKRDESHTTPITLAAGNSSTYDVSVDELSALYVMSSVAENNNLSSSAAILSNYYSAKVQYTTNQYSADESKIAKPVITDVTGVSRGVISYVVQDGESMEGIIAASGVKGLSTDQVRWSNSMKTTEVAAGNTIYLPSVAGIVYVVKAGDTPAVLAEHYGSDAERICSANYLGSNCGLTEGMRIVLPGGELPTTERPEYVPPKRNPSSSASYNKSYALTYTSGNPYVAGQCTWYAWQWWHNNLGRDLPSNLGNARTWGARAAAGGYTVNKTPSYGAVFVDPYTSYYGHVGIVISVNADNSITISEMNYGYRSFVVSQRIIDQSTWSRWTFIH